VFGLALAGSTGGFFAPKYFQDVHGWEPSSIAMLNLAGGALAVRWLFLPETAGRRLEKISPD
jgi:hypothetical protein